MAAAPHMHATATSAVTTTTTTTQPAQWTDAVEQHARLWTYRAKVNAAANTLAAAKLARWNLVLKVFFALFTAGTASSGVAGIINARTIEGVLTATLAILLAFLASLQQVWQPDKKIKQHEHHTKLFGTIARDLETQLVLQRHERSAPPDVMFRDVGQLAQEVDEKGSWVVSAQLRRQAAQELQRFPSQLLMEEGRGPAAATIAATIATATATHSGNSPAAYDHTVETEGVWGHVVGSKAATDLAEVSL